MEELKQKQVSGKDTDMVDSFGTKRHVDENVVSKGEHDDEERESVMRLKTGRETLGELMKLADASMEVETTNLKNDENQNVDQLQGNDLADELDERDPTGIPAAGDKNGAVHERFEESSDRGADEENGGQEDAESYDGADDDQQAEDDEEAAQVEFIEGEDTEEEEEDDDDEDEDDDDEDPGVHDGSDGDDSDIIEIVEVDDSDDDGSSDQEEENGSEVEYYY